MSIRPLKRLTSAALCLSLPASALGGGIMLYEIGSDNTGLANAGAAARAQGPATIASNPAGLSYLPGTQVSAGGQLLFGDLGFDVDGTSTASGGDGGNPLGLTPSASFFISQQLDERWTIGFGSYGDFGLAENYDNDWPAAITCKTPRLSACHWCPVRPISSMNSGRWASASRPCTPCWNPRRRSTERPGLARSQRRPIQL